MGDYADHLGIIKQAQLGSRDNMSRLAEQARIRVFVYIYRITLDYHLAQDLSQETVLEMIKALKGLKVERADSFWAWLYRTAMGKIQHHFRHQGNRRIEQKTIFDADKLLKYIPEDRQNGLKDLLKKELSQAVLKAMSQMKIAYRNVLTLRCFDELSYADIAAVTGGTELQTRLLFFRARQSLKKQLARNGFKKENLLPALGLFGAITASTAKPASAASLSAASVKVGLAATVVGTVTSKSGIVAIAAVAIAALTVVGTLEETKHPDSNKNIRDVIRNSDFQNPSFLIRSYNPDGSRWKTTNSVVVFPEELGARSLNPPYSSLNLVLPEGYWLEWGFPGEIIDGPGIDIYLYGKSTGKPPVIFITDGAGQEVQITSAAIYEKTKDGRNLVTFDISGLSLPFKPRAIRIIGADNEGPSGGVELYSIWARVSR